MAEETPLLPLLFSPGSLPPPSARAIDAGMIANDATTSVEAAALKIFERKRLTEFMAQILDHLSDIYTAPAITTAYQEFWLLSALFAPRIRAAAQRTRETSSVVR